MLGALCTITTALLLAAADVPRAQGDYEGCVKKDHDHCDKLCKLDTFWYGVCKFHRDEDFQCLCWRYKLPLDPAVCSADTHKYCNRKCVELYEHEGYCYPHATQDKPAGIARCYCFPEKVQSVDKAAIMSQH